MIFKLNPSQFYTAKQIEYEFSSPVFDSKKFTITVENGNCLMFQVDLNNEIIGSGMDDEDTINEYGKKIYDLYDEILEQID